MCFDIKFENGEIRNNSCKSSPTTTTTYRLLGPRSAIACSHGNERCKIICILTENWSMILYISKLSLISDPWSWEVLADILDGSFIGLLRREAAKSKYWLYLFTFYSSHTLWLIRSCSICSSSLISATNASPRLCSSWVAWFYQKWEVCN